MDTDWEDFKNTNIGAIIRLANDNDYRDNESKDTFNISDIIRVISNRQDLTLNEIIKDTSIGLTDNQKTKLENFVKNIFDRINKAGGRKQKRRRTKKSKRNKRKKSYRRRR